MGKKKIMFWIKKLCSEYKAQISSVFAVEEVAQG